MNPELDELIKDELARKVLEFFMSNPSAIDSASGVGAWVGLDREKVVIVLEELADAGILDRYTEGGTSGYCFTRDRELIEEVRSLLSD